MPVMVSPGDYALWLDSRLGSDPAALLRPCDPKEIEIRKVSRAVNNARNESEKLIEAAED
jgi:putative SOS response-associated peptidase YedK